MAVNPKLILMAIEAARSEKIRRMVLYIVFFVLGLIMLIFVMYGGLMSGLFAVVQNNQLKIEWAYYSKSISDVFKEIKGEISTDIKAEVYDFMPDFPINLSKAIISQNSKGELIVFDENYLDVSEENIPKYTYTIETVTVDERAASRQTLTVKDEKTKTVEYTCIGGNIYLPEFLAMYNVHQTQDFLIGISEENTSDVDKQIEEIVGGIPDTSEDLQNYLNGAWNDAINGGKNSVGINFFETAALKAVIKNANLHGAAKITTRRGENKLSITLETIDSDTWKEVFGIDESLWDYVDQTKMTIEMALDAAKIPLEERTISLDSLVQLTLFEYFDGLFDMPTDSSAARGILSQYGNVSKLHKEDGGDVIDTGMTLRLGKISPVSASLQNNCKKVIKDAFIYDVWDMDQMEIDDDSEMYNRSAVTIAYIIDTKKFEKLYGFSFPHIDGVVADSGYVTLFLEFSCLDIANYGKHDVGKHVSDNFCVGDSHDGNYSEEYDSGSWYHSQDDCVPHVGIKVSIRSGETSKPAFDKEDKKYNGLSAKEIGVAVNPQLWFKGLGSGTSGELLDNVSAVLPK